MRLYVDESGNFALTNATRPAVSCVGVLAIPECRQDHLFKRYARLRTKFPNDKGEVKGRLLDESHIANVIDLLRRYEIIFEVTAVDMSLEIQDDLTRHRDGQAAAIIAGLLPAHGDDFRREVEELAERLMHMPLQLYIQLVAQNETVHRMVRHMAFYYAFRQPKELVDFKWFVDPKSDTGITDWEDWWQSTLGPFLQTKSLDEPIPIAEGGDYRYFEKYFLPLPEHLRGLGKYASSAREEGAIDVRKIVMDVVSFDKPSDYGLELVDILTNASRRALMGNLQAEGFQHLGKLIIHESRKNRLRLISLSRPTGPAPKRPYARAVKLIDAHGRSALPDSFLADDNQRSSGADGK